MISGDYPYMTTAQRSSPAQESVVQLLCAVTRRCCVENVSGNDQDIDAVVVDRFREPVQKGFVFFVPFSAVEGAAEMPVGRVEDFHLFYWSLFAGSGLLECRRPFSRSPGEAVLRIIPFFMEDTSGKLPFIVGLFSRCVNCRGFLFSTSAVLWPEILLRHTNIVLLHYNTYKEDSSHSPEPYNRRMHIREPAIGGSVNP